MSGVAISARDLRVVFKPYTDKSPTLRRALGTGRHHEVAEVVALDGVSFDVLKGEAFGIVGHNGAGKSTLVRLLARTLRPNEGTVEVFGRTSTLLQLGVGFNPQLSGAKNIVLGGLAHGLRLADIEERFDSIVEYAELGNAIHRQLKTYSKGMFSRLAFSISMHLDPDILLLDEVLAVGDEAFRAKSLAAMQSLVERSGTIVFVSHALPTVASFCDRALWLDQGRVKAIDAADTIVDQYRASVASQA